MIASWFVSISPHPWSSELYLVYSVSHYLQCVSTGSGTWQSINNYWKNISISIKIQDQAFSLHHISLCAGSRVALMGTVYQVKICRSVGLLLTLPMWNMEGQGPESLELCLGLIFGGPGWLEWVEWGSQPKSRVGLFWVGKMRECNLCSHFGHSKMSGQGPAEVHLLCQI